MSWPNSQHTRGSDGKVRALTSSDPQWRPVPGQVGVYMHDDDPGHKVEVIAYSCPVCFESKTTYHSLVHATPEGRKVHATCQGCDMPMTVVTERETTGRPKFLKRPGGGFKV